MISAEDRAQVIVELLPYLQKFRDTIIVIKFGGSTMEDSRLIHSVLKDIALIQRVGLHPVIVHGGGKAITQKMEALGLKAQFKQGYRVTDARSIQIVEEVLDQEINKSLVKQLEELQINACSIFGKNIFVAQKALPLFLADGQEVDLGFVGEIFQVNAQPLYDCLHHHVLPVLSPLGCNPEGQVFNVNADLAAMEAAIALRATRLIYLSDVPGLLRNPKDETSLIPTILSSQVSSLKQEGILTGGMVPKIDSAVEALQRGVGKVQFIDGRKPHALLVELFTDAGIGTEVVL